MTAAASDLKQIVYFSSTKLSTSNISLPGDIHFNYIDNPSVQNGIETVAVRIDDASCGSYSAADERPSSNKGSHGVLNRIRRIFADLTATTGVRVNKTVD